MRHEEESDVELALELREHVDDRGLDGDVERGRVDDVLDAPKADYTKTLLSDTPSLEAALAAATA